jgi:cytochrome c
MEYSMRAILVCAALAFGAVAQASAQETIESRLASANADAGVKTFRKCQACHTVDKGGANRVGPNLYGVINRPVASVDGYRYSNALQEYGGEWSLDRLDAYLENPRQTVKGTRMSFAGIKDAAERADLIAYLNTQSDSPLEQGQSENEQSASTEDAETSEEDFGQLVNAPGAEETFYACTACHSEMIVAQQGKTREGWDDMLVWMVEEQGMAEIPEDERNIILDYLAEHYNTDRPNFPR